ncbi:head-tail connector protein [Xenorhabdus hominickii]|uniref:Phage gp6-like head-tail connector family protein n=1 Tax=Xenorhabdus hominickii TaxID=351679 RepID=A0ABN4S1S5_XENHO|nr:head-tail connector protein [Xenorhabdus hominickii]AOM40019.1 hypothetical protein A9255_05170 [Xenorhabdus hominickii]
MPCPTLEKIKAQCRIDEDNHTDDSLLETYAAAAKTRAESYLNRTLYDENVPDGDPDGLLISADIELALLLAIGFWNENREAQSLPAGFKALLEPYRHINL